MASESYLVPDFQKWSDVSLYHQFKGTLVVEFDTLLFFFHILFLVLFNNL